MLTNFIGCMNKTGIFGFYGNLRRKITKSQISILAYHRVGPQTDEWSLNPLSEKIFEYHINYLSKNFKIVTLSNLSEMIRNGNVPEKAVVITFDDGYKDNYEVAFPILKKYNAPATVFLATGPVEEKNLFWWDKINYALFHTDMESIDLNHIGAYQLCCNEDKILAGLNIQEKLKKMDNNKKETVMGELINLTDVTIPEKLGKKYLLSWDEIKKMNKNGIEFGSHTVTHPILTNVSIDKAKWELINSKKCIEENLETEVKSFAYPNGDFNAKLSSLVENLGYTSSVSVFPMQLLKNSVNELYKLSRINANIKDFNILKLYLCGLRGDLNRILI
ncbi:polysaccharide deacetylase family protein [Methanobacterium oryzae]|uniref:polysaccharide deacetylase family protein n=1 Tax=Methanobacterium oryzae TaxID=69540 RepID=UPI003D19F16F